MKDTLSENSLSVLSAFIAGHLALSFPRDRWNDLERKIEYAAKGFGFDEPEKFISHLLSSPLTQEDTELLASYLTINETYFWREPQTFEALEQTILPQLIQLRKEKEKKIRIWCAGCSTGEEAYSIAILIRKLLPDLDSWNIQIQATDISKTNLEKAIAGEYGQWSFRNVPKWLKEKYFIKNEKGKFEILPEIKKMVKFKYLNLAEDFSALPINDTHSMDLIFCRNVLMYFTAERFEQAVKGFYKSLTEGGYLIVSASELSFQNYSQFTPVNFPGAIVYLKSGKELSKTAQKNKPITPLNIISITDSGKNKPGINGIPKLPGQKIRHEKVPVPSLNGFPPPAPIQKARKEFQDNNPLKIAEITIPGQTLETAIHSVRALADQGNLANAITLCKQAIADHKLNPGIHYLYATILQENKQMDEAISSLKKAIYLDPDFVMAYYSLGNIYQRQGNLPAAKKCKQNILSILDHYNPDEILTESDGLTVSKFKEIIQLTTQTKAIG